MTDRKHIRIWILLSLMAVLFLINGCGDSAFSTSTSPGGVSGSTAGLQVHFIDVGQGDSILVESDGHYMLVDAGENDQAGVVVSYLKEEGVSTLDYVIGTHPHSDHIGGLDKVIDTFSVDKVILPPVEHTTKTFEDVLNSISDKGLKITKPVPGSGYVLGGASFSILAPVKQYKEDLNNWSVGIRLSYGDNHFVLCGDAEAQAEADMVNNGEPLQSDVLKAGHHGSSTSTSDAFLKKVSPSYVVIQCGKDNSYGHPHKETMEKLEKAGCQVFRTDEDGTIVASSDGTHLSFTTSRGGAALQSDTTYQQEDTVSRESGDSMAYILNTNTKKFHLPNCSSAQDIKPENRQDSDLSREKLLEMGYEPCGRCRP